MNDKSKVMRKHLIERFTNGQQLWEDKVEFRRLINGIMAGPASMMTAMNNIMLNYVDMENKVIALEVVLGRENMPDDLEEKNRRRA